MANKPKNLTLAAILVLVFTVNSSTAFAQAAGTDIIVFKSGEEKRGVGVISETYKEIKVKEKAAPGASISEKTYPAGDILTIRHGKTPPKYSAGQAFQNQDRYEEAIKKYEEAAAGGAGWIKSYSYFNIARCLWTIATTAKGGYERALNAYQRVLNETPTARFAPDAKLGVGRCYFEMRQLNEAQTTFRQLEEDDYGEGWKLSGQYWQGRVLDAQRKFANAVQTFARVAEKAKESYPEVYHDAQLARGKSLTKKKDFPKAESILTQLAEETDANLEEVKAAAYNALGDCYWAQEKYRDALFAFLRVKVLYFSVEDEHAYALYWAGRCFEKYKDDRAQELYAELITKHPDSDWSKKIAPKGEE